MSEPRAMSSSAITAAVAAGNVRAKLEAEGSLSAAKIREKAREARDWAPKSGGMALYFEELAAALEAEARKLDPPDLWDALHEDAAVEDYGYNGDAA